MNDTTELPACTQQETEESWDFMGEIETAFAELNAIDAAGEAGDEEQHATVVSWLREALADNPDLVATLDERMEVRRLARTVARTVFVAKELPAFAFYHDTERDDWVLINTRTLRAVCMEVPAHRRGWIGQYLVEGKGGKGRQWQVELNVLCHDDAVERPRTRTRNKKGMQPR